jgi:hypothetical protein
MSNFEYGQRGSIPAPLKQIEEHRDLTLNSKPENNFDPGFLSYRNDSVAYSVDFSRSMSKDKILNFE